MAKKARRSDGRFSSQVYLGIIDGKRKYKTVYGSSPGEVKTKVDEIKHSMGMGIDFTQSISTFAEWQVKWLAALQRKVSSNQYHLYKYRIEYFNAYVGRIPVLRIKLYELQEAMDDLADKNPRTGFPSSKKTLINYKSAVNMFFEYLMDNRVVEYNPAKNLYIPKDAPQDERRALTAVEQSWIREFNHRAQTPAMITMYSGLRRGELTALTWADVDFDNKTITVNKSWDFKSHSLKPPKTEAGYRTVTMPDELVEYLKKIPKVSTLVCTNTKGTMILGCAWERLWDSYMKALNKEYGDFSSYTDLEEGDELPFVIDYFTLHCLRHTYSTLLHDAGVDILTAQYLLGHADAATTMGIYTHLSKENAKKNVDKLNNYLSCKSNASQDVNHKTS